MPLMTDPSLTLRSVIGGMLDEAYMPLTIKINFISQVDFTYREQPIGIVGTLESHGLFVSIRQLIQDMHSQDMVFTTTSCCFHNQENKVLFFHSKDSNKCGRIKQVKRNNAIKQLSTKRSILISKRKTQDAHNTKQQQVICEPQAIQLL